jgi:hypothetical protein
MTRPEERLSAALDRYDGTMAASRGAMWHAIQQLAKETEAEMIVLEASMLSLRYWLDMHRDDPRHMRRHERFFSTEVKRHAAMGDVLNRYAQRLVGDASAIYQWGETKLEDTTEQIEAIEPNVPVVKKETPTRSTVLARRFGG